MTRRPDLLVRWDAARNLVELAYTRARIADTRSERERKQAVGLTVRRLDERLPKVVATMIATCPDGYPTGTLGGGGSGGMSSVESATSERALQIRRDYAVALEQVGWIAVHARWALDGAVWGVESTLRCLGYLWDVCDRYERPEAALVASVRCTGGAGEPGFLEWGRPECDNIAAGDRKGMCIACYTRQRRWEKRRQEGAA